MRKPLKNAFLQNDALGNGKRWTGLGGLEVGYLETKEIWIGQRTSNKAGSGSKIDPFNGATREQFDTLLSGLSPSYRWIIYLLDGEYETHGALEWQLMPKWALIGAGMWQTILRQMFLPAENVNFGVVYGNSDDIEARDLTIDCNYTALMSAQDKEPENQNIYGIGGRCGILHNIRMIHCGGDEETFGINLSALGPVGETPTARDAAAPRKCEIIGCRVEEPDTEFSNAITGITINAGYFESDEIPMEDEEAWGGSAVIENCYVDGGPYTEVKNSTIAIAYQIGGFRHAVMSKCYARNANVGFFQDTCPTRNLTLEKSTMDGVGIGVLFNGGGNNVTRGGRITGLDIITYGSGIGLNSANHMTVEDNHLWPVPGADVSAGLIFQNKNADEAVDTSNNLYRNNRIDPAFTLAEVLPADGATGTPQLWNNRYFDGSSIAKVPDNYFPYNGPLLPTLVERADNASGTDQVIADGAQAILDLDQVTYNTGLIDLDTNKMMTLSAGVVKLTAFLALSDVTPGGYMDLSIYLGEQSVALARIQEPIANQSYHVSLDFPAAAEDEFTVRVANETGDSITIDKNYLLTYLSLRFEPHALAP